MGVPGRHQRVFLVFLLLCLVSNLAALDPGKQVQIKVWPQPYDLVLDGTVLKWTKGKSPELRTYRLPLGSQSSPSVQLMAPGYEAISIEIKDILGGKTEFKLERSQSGLKKLGELPTGKQPKSVVFSPDGSQIFVAQLQGPGVDVYSTEPFAHKGQIKFPVKIAAKQGFVELALLPWQDELWVSQMTSDSVHVVRLSTLEYRYSMATGGNWPKVIAVHPYRDLAFVTNWVGESVAVFNTLTHKRTGLWKTTGTPRGMAFSPDGIFLYVASFGTGYLDKFRVRTGKKEKTINMGSGAKRHLVVHPSKPILYATDMEKGEVWVFDMLKDSLIKRIPLGPKLNTCDLSPDGRFLFISSRGTNGVRDYLFPGPDFGTVSVIDTEKLEKVDWAWGRNQPTGLAVHPRLPLLAFTDFLDANLELYDYSGLY